MAKQINKISTGWIRQTRDDFRAFLDETDFPDPKRLGDRGPVFRNTTNGCFNNCETVSFNVEAAK